MSLAEQGKFSTILCDTSTFGFRVIALKTSSCSLIRYPRFAKAAATNSRKAFAVPASKRSRDKQSYSGAPLVILCGEGGFTKRTLERSECVSV